MTESLQKIKETLKNWPLMVRKYQKSCKKIATQQIITSLLPFIGITILAYFVYPYSKTAAILLGFINSLFLIRIFIIQHDCGHMSFFKSKKLNDRWGFFCSLFTSFPYQYWARSHAYHHQHNGQLENRDIGDINTLTVKEFDELSTIQKWGYRVYRHPFILFGIGLAYYLFVPLRSVLPFNRATHARNLQQRPRARFCHHCHGL